MDTKAIKPEDNKGGTFTAQLTAEEVTSASVTPVPTQAPGIIWAEPGTTKEEAIYYKTKDAEAGTISGLIRDFTNLNGGTGQQHENSADWEVLQSSRTIENLVDIILEGFIQEQNTITRVDDTSFTIQGNVSTNYNKGRLIRFNQDNTEIVRVVSATYSAGTGLTTIVIEDNTIPATLTTAEYSIQPKGTSLARVTDVITKTNTDEFVPTADYHPATKKYIDDITTDLSPYHSLSRQAIINGNFDVWQRGTSIASGVGGTAYCADRWRTSSSGSNQTAALSTDVPNAQSLYSVKLTATADASYNALSQRIESWNCRALVGGKGTLSFWIKAVKLQTIRIQFAYADAKDNFAAVTQISNTDHSASLVANTWTKITKTIDFPAEAANGLQISLFTNYATATETETYISQVQLCAGEVALPFQPKSETEELRDCLKYCYIPDALVSGQRIGMGGIAISTTSAIVQIPLPVRMRIIPALVATAGDFRVTDIVSVVVNLTNLSIASSSSRDTVSLICTVASGLTQYRTYSFSPNADNKRLILSAEL